MLLPGILQDTPGSVNSDRGGTVRTNDNNEGDSGSGNDGTDTQHGTPSITVTGPMSDTATELKPEGGEKKGMSSEPNISRLSCFNVCIRLSESKSGGVRADNVFGIRPAPDSKHEDVQKIANEFAKITNSANSDSPAKSHAMSSRRDHMLAYRQQRYTDFQRTMKAKLEHKYMLHGNIFIPSYNTLPDTKTPLQAIVLVELKVCQTSSHRQQI